MLDHHMAAALEGRHLFPEEGGDDMASRDALCAQLPNVPHCSGKLVVARFDFLPVCPAGQKGDGLSKKWIRLQ
jgi:hypothetical protein